LTKTIPQNPEEIHTICHLVRRYAQAGHDFCVITPYDAQRAAIERQLKAENLLHNAIFNVDSFQGAQLTKMSENTHDKLFARERGRLRRGFCGPHGRTGIPAIAQPHERHVDTGKERHGYCDLFIISPLSRGSNSPGMARAVLGDSAT
jgi:hypothetical protein